MEEICFLDGSDRAERIGTDVSALVINDNEISVNIIPESCFDL